MKELMKYIHNKLSVCGEVFFEDIERDSEGYAKIDDIKIVYDLDGVYQLTDNKVKKDIPLTIDIWSRKDQIYDVEDLVEQLDEELEGRVYRSDTLIFTFKRNSIWSLNLRDEDKNVRRKQLKYVIKYYK